MKRHGTGKGLWQHAFAGKVGLWFTYYRHKDYNPYFKYLADLLQLSLIFKSPLSDLKIKL